MKLALLPLLLTAMLPCLAQSDDNKGPVNSLKQRPAPDTSDDKKPMPSLMHMVAVPNVVGKTLNQAKQILINAKLTHKMDAIAINAGNRAITKQVPAAGTKVKEGTPIVLTVAAR